MNKGSSSIPLNNGEKQVAFDMDFNGNKVDSIRDKLSDGKYIYDAVYCLASILTDKIMDMGGEMYDDDEN